MTVQPQTLLMRLYTTSSSIHTGRFPGKPVQRIIVGKLKPTIQNRRQILYLYIYIYFAILNLIR